MYEPELPEDTDIVFIEQLREYAASIPPGILAENKQDDEIEIRFADSLTDKERQFLRCVRKVAQDLRWSVQETLFPFWAAAHRAYREGRKANSSDMQNNPPFTDNDNDDTIIDPSEDE